jgi:hypothetical protein
MHLRRNINIIKSVANYELSGLSQTAADLELPAHIQEPIDEPVEGEFTEDDVIQADGLGVPEEEVQEIKEQVDKSKEPEDKIKKAIKKRAEKSEKPHKNGVDDKTKESLVADMRSMVSDTGTAITPTEFWGTAKALGYAQKDSEKFLASDDWRVCLKALLDDFEKVENE